MKFISKNSEADYILNIYVKTNSKSQEILDPTDEDEHLIILLRSKPIYNKANKELINILKSKLKISSAQISILSGSKQSNKKVRLIFPKHTSKLEIKEKLLS
ncbi:MAG: DUF167 domain-containing protein [Candidatus Thorarchaeota archaeon]